MNIYIYGSKSFKKDINKLLSKANIIFKLDDAGTIKEIDSVEELKNTIVASPRDIFLIDEDKIIKKGGVEFLKPKDGIERSFLNKYGVGDLSVDTFDDLIEHINARLELKQSQAQDLETSIKSINMSNIDFQNSSIEEDDDDIDDNLINTHLNIDEIDDSDNDIETDITLEEDNIKDELMNIDEMISDVDDTEIDNMDNSLKDDNMDDNIADDIDNIDDLEGLDELDSLDESMLLEALDEADLDPVDTVNTNDNEPIIQDSNNNSLTLAPEQLDTLTQVLSQLLNGKELEITIKVK